MAISQSSARLFYLFFLPLTTFITLIMAILPQRLRTRLIFKKDLAVSIISLAIGRLLPCLSYTPTDLHGKTAIVTGSNSGIGLQIATDLARQGATVILACRNLDRARSALNTIWWRVPESRSRVGAMDLDTSSFDSVKRFVEVWLAERDGPAAKTIDILVHNAGIATPSGGKDMNDDGVDVMYATNVLGSFCLTYFLEPYLSQTARVVFTSSTGQYDTGTRRFSNDFAAGPVRGVIEPGFHCPKGKVRGLELEVAHKGATERYGNTKGMQCVMAKLLQKRWDRESVKEKDAGGTAVAKGRVAHSFTPGFTSTPIFGKLELGAWMREPLFALLRATVAFATDVDQGAMTGSWLASTSDEAVAGPGNGGGYWDRMTRRLCSADMYDNELLERLWTRWENDAGIQWR